MNKEAIQQAEAFLKTNRSFYGEEGFQAYGPYGEKAVALMMAEFAAQCAPVGEAPQIDILQFVKDYWCLLSTDMDKLDSIELTVTPHQLVAMLKEYAKGRENYGTEASNTDEAAVSTIRSSSGNSVDQGENGGWIAVEDGLPDVIEGRYSDRVLCYTTSGYMANGYRIGGDWMYDAKNVRFTDYGYTVTHWMPLPQPPKSK